MFNLEAISSFSEHETIFIERTGQNFTSFYNKFYSRLLFFTTKMCNDTQRAEDVTTESFLIAFQKIDKYEKEKSQFSTWLFTIAKNLMLQEIKNERKSVSMDVELDEEGTTMKDFIKEEQGYEHIIELNHKKAEIMKKHIDDLKEPYRTVIEMRELQKMQYKDIADKLNLNLSTCKSRIRNARTILKSITKKEFDKLDDMFL